MNRLLEHLKRVEKLAGTSRLGRFIAHPVKYVLTILHRKILYRALGRHWKVKTATFFGSKMAILLPGGTDIYLTGGKTHISEIQLARFLIKNLKAGEVFLDIGAHYGFFSLLAAKLVGSEGKVWSIEPSERSFCILSENSQAFEQIHCFKKAVSDKGGFIDFFEFPELYSEYNSIDQTQFREEEWFRQFAPQKTTVEAITLDQFLKDKTAPTVIKIDVEGAEYEVLLGGKTFLGSSAPVLILEYLSPTKGNDSHKRAVKLAQELGYSLHTLDNQGEKSEIPNTDLLDQNLIGNGLESTNVILFKKTI